MRSPTFSKRAGRVKASAIREILKVTERPDVLSFAGGLPAPETFPIDELAKAHADVFSREGAAALQYSTTEGYGPLRGWVAERMRARGITTVAEEVLITSGSQQGIDLVARVLLDPGDTVVVENPSYIAALQVFEAHDASFVTVGSDEHGMRIDQLERAIKRARPRLIYVVPTFQNPKGTTLALERREQLARLAAEHGVAVLEDDPYGELRFSGAEVPAVAALDRRSPIIYLSTFSKTLSPGLRIGWVVASAEAIRAMTVAKQSCDLHTATLAQRAVSRLLETFDYDAHVARICALYRERRDAMLEALEREFPAGTTWTRPDGGLFVWVGVREGVDTGRLLNEALREGVAFVPGAPFFARAPERNYLRLNFSNRPREVIADGMKRLAAAVARAPLATPIPPPPVARIGASG
jgi:2-aminoadipate transaminase